MMLTPLLMEQEKHDGSGAEASPSAAHTVFNLGDLGKPTMRGVRKCTKCGMLNGTRGTRCKNPKCDMLFRSAERHKPSGPEAVKLITDPGIQIYSVRTKTGDSRGFVQLPIVQDLEGNPAVVDVGIVCSAAKCYVETCARAKNDGLDPCWHIRSSVEALEEATPLTFKNSVLNSMPISTDMRQQIWAYATEKPGPLVQRVSKNIMSVKTSVTVKNPLGYLHFTFFPNKKDEKRFVCSCKDSKIGRVTMFEGAAGSECCYRIQRCVHYYACVCAFASDEALSKEFKFAIDADTELEIEQTVVSGRVEIENSSEENSAAIESVTEVTEEEIQDSGLSVSLATGADGEEVIITTDDDTITYMTGAAAEVSPTHKRPLQTTTSTSLPITPLTKRFKPESVLIHQPHNNVQNVHQPFHAWLSSVTERINSTMHYSLQGNPKPLVFHIPQAFWDCLITRISLSSYLKRRLPNKTVTVCSNTTPPLGTFTKYSWYITEMAHLRKIFDTSEISLMVSKYYDRAADGTYHISQTPRVQVDTMRSQYIEHHHSASDSHEYKTYLRVGKQGNQGLIAAFVIDWIPDLLPTTRTGELTLTFQYSHMIDGLSPAVDDDLVQHIIETSSHPTHNQNIIIETTTTPNKHSQQPNIIIEHF